MQKFDKVGFHLFVAESELRSEKAEIVSEDEVKDLLVYMISFVFWIFFKDVK